MLCAVWLSKLGSTKHNRMEQIEKLFENLQNTKPFKNLN